jgi:hypothetical protein
MTLFNAATGAIVSTQDFPVTPFDQRQFPATGAAQMTAELRVISGDARILAFGSVVDNHSGDPIYVAAKPPIQGAFVAPVISQPGVNTFWRSDIFLTAPDDSGGSFDLTYVDAVTGERLVKHGSVTAHQAIRLDDVIGNSFGRSGFGTLRADLTGSIIATSRTFTTSSNGTFGQFIPLTSIADADGTPRELIQIEHSTSFRTNLGAINTSDTTQILRFTLYDAAGHSLGSVDRMLDPLRLTQFPVDSITASPFVNGRVEVQIISGGSKALVWASVVDNITGDPIFIPAQ